MDVNEIPVDTPESGPRLIKRYANRKLYDTRKSRYVTLVHIADMVRAGEDVQVIDNDTKEDKTDATLALILSEELKSQPRTIPLGTLRALIQAQRDKFLLQLREGPIGKLIPGTEEKEETAQATGEQPPSEENGERRVEAAPKGEAESAEVPARPEKSDIAKGLRFHGLVESSKATLDQWHHAIDERIRAVLPSFSAFHDLQLEVRKLTKKVEELEGRLRSRGGKDESGGE